MSNAAVTPVTPAVTPVVPAAPVVTPAAAPVVPAAPTPAAVTPVTPTPAANVVDADDVVTPQANIDVEDVETPAANTDVSEGDGIRVWWSWIPFASRRQKGYIDSIIMIQNKD